MPDTIERFIALKIVSIVCYHLLLDCRSVTAFIELLEASVSQPDNNHLILLAWRHPSECVINGALVDSRLISAFKQITQ